MRRLIIDKNVNILLIHFCETTSRLLILFIPEISMTIVRYCANYESSL